MWLSKKSCVFNKLVRCRDTLANKKAVCPTMAVLMRYEIFPGRNKKDWRRRMLPVQSRVERERSTKAADCDCPDYYSLRDCLLLLVSHALATSSRLECPGIADCLCCCHRLSLLSIQLTEVEGDVPTFIKPAVPLLLPTFSTSGLDCCNRSRAARAFRLCFNEHPTSSAHRLCLGPSRLLGLYI